MDTHVKVIDRFYIMFNLKIDEANKSLIFNYILLSFRSSVRILDVRSFIRLLVCSSVSLHELRQSFNCVKISQMGYLSNHPVESICTWGGSQVPWRVCLQSINSPARVHVHGLGMEAKIWDTLKSVILLFFYDTPSIDLLSDIGGPYDLNYCVLR